MSIKNHPRSFLDRCFRDDSGHLAVVQAPNAPIMVWIISTVLSNLTNGRTAQFFETIAFGALFTWAWLELFHGSNYFRRVLGLTVLVMAVLNRL